MRAEPPADSGKPAATQLRLIKITGTPKRLEGMEMTVSCSLKLPEGTQTPSEE